MATVISLKKYEATPLEIADSALQKAARYYEKSQHSYAALQALRIAAIEFRDAAIAAMGSEELAKMMAVSK